MRVLKVLSFLLLLNCTRVRVTMWNMRTNVDLSEEPVFYWRWLASLFVLWVNAAPLRGDVYAHASLVE